MNLEKKIWRGFRKTILPLVAASLLYSCPFPINNDTSDRNKKTESENEETEETTGYDYTTKVRNILSQNINSVGGLIEVTDISSYLFKTKLEIPPNALRTTEQISIGEVDNPPNLPSGLNYIGSAVDIEPDGLRFSKPVTIQIPYYDNFLSDAGTSEDSNLKLFGYNKSSNRWIEMDILSHNKEDNLITAKINHFSYYAITFLSSVPPSDLGTPLPGDLIYTTGAFWKEGDRNLKDNWMPGHVGIYVGEKEYWSGLASDDVKKFKRYNVVEALEQGVQFSYYDIPNVTETFENQLKSFSGNNQFMGAREPDSGTLTSQQRETIVNYVESQIGKPYAWGQTIGVFYGMLQGSLVKGPNLFNCVGLAEKAYELAGVNNGDGLTTLWQEDYPKTVLGDLSFAALTPAEHYNSTRPASGQNLENDPSLPLEKIVFASNRDGNSEIYSMDSDGSNVQRLTDNTFPDGYPRWSQDKESIFFVSNRGEKGDDIYRMKKDGSEERLIISGSSTNGDPTHSYIINETLALRSNRTGIDKIHLASPVEIMGDIYWSVIQSPLTKQSGSEGQPCWNSEGELAYVSSKDGGLNIYKIYSSGMGLTQLTFTGRGIYNMNPSWSPDGKRIVFCSNRDGNFEIYSIRSSDGSDIKRLTNNPSEDLWPSWSKNGIYFTTNRDGNFEIYSMNADGTNTQNLTNNSYEDMIPN